MLHCTHTQLTCVAYIAPTTHSPPNSYQSYLRRGGTTHPPNSLSSKRSACETLPNYEHDYEAQKRIRALNKDKKKTTSNRQLFMYVKQIFHSNIDKAN